MKTYKEWMNEATLSRVLSHVKGDKPVVIMTAFRGGNTYKENVKRNKALAQTFRKAGYGYFFVDGHWVEKDGNNENDTSEDSVFIIGNANDSGQLKKLAIELMKKYNQDAIIFKPEKETTITLLFQDGKSESLGKTTPDKVAQAYTKLRGRGGRTFVFESAYEEKSWISKQSI